MIDAFEVQAGTPSVATVYEYELMKFVDSAANLLCAQ